MAQVGIEWVDGEYGLRPVLRKEDGNTEDVEWAPQPGSQQIFLQCPLPEALIEGSRGGGKTDTLLMDFAQHVGQGWGQEWKGVLFRRTYPELEDIIAKSKKWFSRVFPRAVYNEAKSSWRWPSGETLKFRHFSKSDDYWSYHGTSFTWIAWEELTTWPNDECLKAMMSCLRSPVKGIPLKIRATTNPYGSGHGWCKERYQLPTPPGKIVGTVVRGAVDKDGNEEPARVAIHSSIWENKVLLSADPKYIQRIASAARNESERIAWLEGSWDIVSGGMFDDVWTKHNVLPDLLGVLPRGWRINRSFDWGSAKPFSVGWWAESDGTPVELRDGRLLYFIPGDKIRVAEWYGWTGKSNKGLYLTNTDIALGVRQRDKDLFPRHKVKPGPADASIFSPHEGEKSIANIMSREGINWIPSYKGQGSRENGWQMMREMIKNAQPATEGLLRERPGLFVTEICTQFLRTVPVLPRDDRKIDDVDTDAEDHIGDETRYQVYRGVNRLRPQRVVGH